MTEDRLSVVDLIDANLIHDYSSSPQLPVKLWPRDAKNRDEVDLMIHSANQFQGTNAEQLAEVAGRACYDSFGKGRTSKAFHAHILEVKHGSVHEHFNFTVEVEVSEQALAVTYAALANRPGLFVNHSIDEDSGQHSLRITANMRSMVEWHNWSPTEDHNIPFFGDMRKTSRGLGACLRGIATELAPNIVILGEEDEEVDGWFYYGSQVTPIHDEEKWITMLLTGSRGFSHELVRHGDRTAISQRSTRYVDENESPWVWHPLIMQWIGDTVNNGYSEEEAYAELGLHVEEECKKTYGKIVEHLQPWLIEKLEAAGTIDPKFLKTSARKQARGAARGFLGNALYTEVVFSASVAQWNRILRQRAGGPADAEIRESFAEKVLPILQDSQYADSFEQWELYECEDGIGQAAREVGS